VGSTTTEYVFNASGQRVSEWNGTTRAQLKGKYYWGGKPVAYYAGGSTHFEHQDWLGTERLRTSYNGGVEGSYISQPWGDGFSTLTGTDADANHYGTLDHDAETSTDHAEFRQYSEAQGRWLSPDPYDGSYDGSNPQSFNRYVYAGNNPLAAVDQSGLTPTHPRNPNQSGSGPTICVSIDGGICAIQEVNTGSGIGQALLYGATGEVIFSSTSNTSYSLNVYSLGAPNSNIIDEYGSTPLYIPYEPLWVADVVVTTSTYDFSWYLNSFTPYAPYQLAQNGSPNNYTKAQNLSVLDPNYQYKKLLYSYCKDSAGQRVTTSIRNGAITGGATGAFFGGVSGELFGGEVSLGATGVAGAYLGAHVGGVMGAIRGLDLGLLSAGGCALLGAY